MIDHTNLEDYDDPVIYDLENKDVDDVSFYLSLAQEVSGAAVPVGSLSLSPKKESQ